MERREHCFEPCTICNDKYTATHTEIKPGLKIFVCDDCIEAAIYNFIWVCLHCGRAYLRPKKALINAVTDEEIQEAYQLCEKTHLIQAIEMCSKCDPNGTERYMKINITNMDC